MGFSGVGYIFLEVHCCDITFHTFFFFFRSVSFDTKRQEVIFMLFFQLVYTSVDFEFTFSDRCHISMLILFKF